MASKCPFQFNEWLGTKLNLLQPVLLLVVRLYIGYQAAISGWGHLSGFSGTVDQFKEWGIPFPALNVAISGTTELVGGILFGLGLFSRIVSIPFTFNFIIAIVSLDLHYPKYRDMLIHFWRDQTFIFVDTAFPFLCAGILVMVFGPGLFSVDGIVAHFRKKKTNPTS